MKDNEIRGILLQRYYERRRERYIAITPDELPVKLTQEDIVFVSQQLADHKLLEFKAALDSKGQLRTGMGHILAAGIDVVENGGTKSPIYISFDHSTKITVENSSNVQFGKGNIQGDIIHIQSLLKAIDDAQASDEQKREAKSKIKQLLDNPLVKEILIAAAKGVFSSVSNGFR